MSNPNEPLSFARSRSSSNSSRPKTPLSLDLSNVPALITPTPPTNTLIITNLDDPSIFHPQNIATIRDLINSHSLIHTFAPLKSFRRIIVSFYTIEAAANIRSQLDGTDLMSVPVRVFYGADTPLTQADQHLELPKSARLFFISPPPSPPHGWEQINEDPPNKQVHADDLAAALAQLRSRDAEPLTPVTDKDPSSPVGTRTRGNSTVVYRPEDHGDSPHLPAIEVEDTTWECATPEELSPMEDIRNVKSSMNLFHTPRPPVELM